MLILLVLLSIFINPIYLHAEGKYKYAKTTINIRDKPNIKSKIIGQIYWNEKIKILKKVNKEWYLTSYKKKKGYICSKYLRKSKKEYKVYLPPSQNTFKSYEDADCITDSNNLAQGRLKKKYHLDCRSGIWMVGNRYCIAVGSYYTKQIGAKIDLVLSHNGRKHVLKCIAADSKADKDTVNQHRIHSDGSIVEFVVSTSSLPLMARQMGDVSYAGDKFKGRIEQIRVYK